MGYLKSFNESNVLVIDKFFLGGPLNVRGFQQNCAGPRTKAVNGSPGASLGGTAYWATGLHLYVPLPWTNDFCRNFRLHGFANAGNLDKDVNRDLLTKDVRVSAGGGVVLAIGKARLEVNYCVPLSHQPDDLILPGFQFGIGFNYVW